MCLVCWLALASTPLTAQVTPRQDRDLRVVDPVADPRLRLVTSLSTHHATVGAVLKELSKQTGISLSTGSPQIEEEPITAFVRDRPLHSLLSLLAQVFRTGKQHQSGWFWTARSVNGVRRYQLNVDTAYRALAEDTRARDRRWFAEELLQRDEIPKRRRPEWELLDLIPASVLGAALRGGQPVLAWREWPDTLRAFASKHLKDHLEAPAGGPWARVRLSGEGRSLRLALEITGGDGMHVPWSVRPEGYLERWTRAQAARLAGHSTARVHSGASAAPTRLSPAEAPIWNATRELCLTLRWLSERSGTDILCDEYGYSTRWSPDFTQEHPFPRGEPLGFWLDALPFASYQPRSMEHPDLEWREHEGAIVIRNRDWYAEDLLRPRAEVRRWLRGIIQTRKPPVLTLDEAARLWEAVPVRDGNIAALQVHGLIRSGGDLQSKRGFLRWWRSLDANLRRKAYSREGLRIGELPPAQRAAATEVGPDIESFVSESVLARNFGGDLTMFLEPKPPAIKRTYQGDNGLLIHGTVDLSLPEPTVVECRVVVKPPPNANEPRSH
jgi:hypothetical protein